MRKKKNENGQAIVIIAISLVVLLGFTGLAIDGGLLYSDRRNAQNIADAAAMAGAGQAAKNLKDATGSDWATKCSNLVSGAQSSAINRASSNGISLTAKSAGDLAASHNGVNVQCNTATPQSLDVTVEISTTTPTFFVQFVFNGPLRSQVQAVARVLAPTPAMPGQGIIAMEDLCNTHLNDISISGGGNSGNVQVISGGIFINTVGSATCGISPGNSSGGGFVIADTITNVGSYNYGVNDHIIPSPITTGANGGTAIGDPLAGLAEPTCSSSGSIQTTSGNNTFNPGNIAGSVLSNGGTLNPGTYCITGSVALKGQTKLLGNNVLLYFKDGALSLPGQGGLTISAQTTGTYAGIAIFAARSNTNTIDIKGNGGQAVVGMIYALNGVIQAVGGGKDPEDINITGQLIANQIIGNGNGSLIVTYDGEKTYHTPTTMSLYK